MPRSSSSPQVKSGYFIHTTHSNQADGSTDSSSVIIERPLSFEEYMALQMMNPNRFDLYKSTNFSYGQRDESNVQPPGSGQRDGNRHPRFFSRMNRAIRLLYNYIFSNRDSSNHNIQGDSDNYRGPSEINEEFSHCLDYENTSAPTQVTGSSQRRDVGYERMLSNAIAQANCNYAKFLDQHPQHKQNCRKYHRSHHNP